MKKGWLFPGRTALLILAGAFAGLSAPAPLTAQGKTGVGDRAATLQNVEGIAVHYYSGAMRIDQVVVLDEFVLVNKSAGSGDGASTLLPKARLSEPDHTGRVRFAKPENALAGLAELATISAGAAELGIEVQAVLLDRRVTSREAASPGILTRRFSLKVQPGVDVKALAARHGFSIVEVLDFSPNTYIAEASGTDPLGALETANALYETETGVEFASPEIRRERVRRFTPNDTYYPLQWHLNNTGQAVSSTAGEDVNILGAWQNYTGAGINIAIVDDGLEHSHEDLVANARTDIDIDINYGDNDPFPDVSGDDHGTSCAGMAAGKGGNGIGVTGAAPDAGLVGVRLISDGVSDSQEAQAMGYLVNPVNASDRVSISSNSWGPPDDGYRKETWGPVTAAAIQNAVQNGRGGLGTIFVWAAGNGRPGDNVNYDGYASSRYTIAVGATGAGGVYSSYSEPGASMLINAPSSDSFNGTVTVDRTGSAGYNGIAGNDKYTNDFGGTSSACPLVAGCVALILEANPNLTWRDVQHILVETADKNNPTNSGWITNGAGRPFNHAYGFGRIDVSEAVTVASTWTNVPAYQSSTPATRNVNFAIPDNNATGVSSSQTISLDPNFVIEHVEVVFNALHTYRGDLDIRLTSPSGTVSQFTELHDDFNSNYSNWMFTSAAHWGESPNGAWTMQVADLYEEDTGTWQNWTIQFHGYIRQTGTQTPSPSPSPTATASPTQSPSPTTTASATGTPSATVTPTVTPAPTGTQTPSPTVTVSPTASVTVTPTGTQTPEPTLTATASPSPSPSPSPTASLVYTIDDVIARILRDQPMVDLNRDEIVDAGDMITVMGMK